MPNRILFHLPFLYLVTVVFATSSVCAQEPIKLGGIFCLTGEVAMACNGIREGVEVAVDEVNATGGVILADGKKHSVIMDMQDSHFEPKTANLLAARMVADPAISGILVTTFNEMKSASFVTEKAKLSSIVLWDSTPEMDALGEAIFSVGPWLPSTYEVSAKFARQSLKAESAAVLNSVQEWSEQVGKGFVEEFTKLGGRITDHVETIAEEKDYRAAVLKIIAKKPDLLYIPIGQLDLVLKQLRTLNYQGKIATSDNLTNELLSLDPPLYEGVYQSAVGDPETSNAQHLAKLYEERFTSKPKMLVFHAWGYDGVHLLAHALANTDGSRQAVLKGLKGITHDGALGRIQFTSGGSWKMEPVMFQVQKGKLVQLR